MATHLDFIRCQSFFFMDWRFLLRFCTTVGFFRENPQDKVPLLVLIKSVRDDNIVARNQLQSKNSFSEELMDKYSTDWTRIFLLIIWWQLSREILNHPFHAKKSATTMRHCCWFIPVIGVSRLGHHFACCKEFFRQAVISVYFLNLFISNFVQRNSNGKLFQIELPT